MAKLFTKYGVDFETIGNTDDAQIVFVPIDGKPQYWVAGKIPTECNFKCSLEFNSAKMMKFLNAVQLPERKTVNWRGKRMLVRKTPQKSVTMSFTGKQYKDIYGNLER